MPDKLTLTSAAVARLEGGTGLIDMLAGTYANPYLHEPVWRYTSMKDFDHSEIMLVVKLLKQRLEHLVLDRSRNARMINLYWDGAREDTKAGLAYFKRLNHHRTLQRKTKAELRKVTRMLKACKQQVKLINAQCEFPEQ